MVIKLVVINIDYKLKTLDLLHDLFFICNIILVLGLDRFCSGFSSTPPRQCSAATRAFSLSSTPLALTEMKRRDPFFSQRRGSLITIALQFLKLEVLSVSNYHAIGRTQ